MRYGIAVADLAVKNGVSHLVYSSVGTVNSQPTGMGHFDSKMRIEEHIRSLPIRYTIVRPTSFMELLVMPGFGLDEGRFNFFMAPDQHMQVLAVRDIGRYVSAIFADPERFVGVTMTIASDSLTGNDLQAAFSEAAGAQSRHGVVPDLAGRRRPRTVPGGAGDRRLLALQRGVNAAPDAGRSVPKCRDRSAPSHCRVLA